MKNILRYAFLALALPIGSFADEIDLSIGTDPTLDPVYREAIVPLFMDRINDATDGQHRVNWNSHFDGSYFGFRYSVGAVESELVDISIGSTYWDAKRFPLQNMTYSAPFATDDLSAMVEVVNQLHAEKPILGEAWAEIDAVYLTALGIPNYHLATTFPVTSFADLRGQKILAPGPLANWVRGLDAVPVNGVDATYALQISDGDAVGAVLPLSVYMAMDLHKAAPHLTLVGFGAQIDRALIIGKEAWEGLPNDARQVMTETATEFARNTSQTIMALERAHLDALGDLGVKVQKLPEMERMAWAEKVRSYLSSLDRETDAEIHAEILSAYGAKLKERGLTPLVE